MSKLVGYIRVSVPEDYAFRFKLERAFKKQEDKLRDKNCEEFYSDKGTDSIGSLSSQPGLNNAINSMQEGDTLVVCSLDKLGLSLTNLIRLFIKLDKMKIGFISIEDEINTNLDDGFLYRISKSFRKCAKKLKSEHGVITARRGEHRMVKVGKKSKLNEQQIKELLRRYYIDKENYVKGIYVDLGISKTSFNNYVKKYKYNYQEFLDGKIS
jgi:DNA invertase Pin-like site-specific DNA recombinase